MATSIASCSIIERAATLVSTHPHRHGRGTQKVVFIEKTALQCSRGRAKIRPAVPAAPMIAACTAASPPPLPWIFPSLLEPPKDLVYSSLAIAGLCCSLTVPKAQESHPFSELFFLAHLCWYTRVYLPCLPMFGCIRHALYPFSSTYMIHSG